jgi:hypothetical protein
VINLPVVGRFGQTRVRIERSGRGGWARHKERAVLPAGSGQTHAAFWFDFRFFKRQLKGAITVYCSGSYIFAHTQPKSAQQITRLDDPRECPDTQNGECMCGATQSNGRIATVLSLRSLSLVCYVCTGRAPRRKFRLGPCAASVRACAHAQ